MKISYVQMEMILINPKQRKDFLRKIKPLEKYICNSTLNEVTENKSGEIVLI